MWNEINHLSLIKLIIKNIMKRLFKEDRPLEFFFDAEVTLEEVSVWVMLEIDKLALELNEPNSCTVDIDGENIVISGDEDLLILQLLVINPIAL